MKFILILASLFSLSAFADYEAQYTPQFPDQEGMPYRLFRAEGVHICWSDKVIGNTCFVHGTNYTDCLTAHANLKIWDCCRSTPGSHSVNFVMSKCTNF